MLNQTIQEIIIELNIERVKSKDTNKLTDITEVNLARKLLNFQKDNQSSTKSISPDCERSCSGRAINSKNIMPNGQKIYRKKWTKSQQQLLCKLIGRYGSDFTFLQTQFSNKTRKQLKKKYQQIHKSKYYLAKIEKIEESLIRQRRKSLFDEEIMEISSTESSEKKQSEDHQATNLRYHDIQHESQDY